MNDKHYLDYIVSTEENKFRKIGQYPSVCMIYKGVPAGHPDEKPLEIALALLHNSSATGALDKLSIDGEITNGSASLEANRQQGRCKIAVTPLYDENQRRFESNKSAEKKALKAIQQIANGEV